MSKVPELDTPSHVGDHFSHIEIIHSELLIFTELTQDVQDVSQFSLQIHDDRMTVKAYAMVKSFYIRRILSC